MRYLVVSIVVFLVNSLSLAQSENYYQLFPKEFNETSTYLIANKWMKDTLQSRGIDPNLAISIVFPELLRYHKLQNQIEVTALKTLYIQYGASFADFSIGHFQMKPSFAEEVEYQWNHLRNKSELVPNLNFDTNSSPKARALRVQRLNHDQGQLLYLSLFYFLAEIKFKSVAISAYDKIRLFATAYNVGFSKDVKTIIAKSTQKQFAITLYPLPFSERYSYADIALYFYKYQQKMKF